MRRSYERTDTRLRAFAHSLCLRRCAQDILCWLILVVAHEWDAGVRMCARINILRCRVAGRNRVSWLAVGVPYAGSCEWSKWWRRHWLWWWWMSPVASRLSPNRFTRFFFVCACFCKFHSLSMSSYLKHIFSIRFRLFYSYEYIWYFERILICLSGM